MKLSTKFIILGVIAVLASTGNGLVGAAARYKMVELDNEQALATQVQQRHMEGDMKREAIWGEVMSAIVAENIGDTAAAEKYKAATKENVALFAQYVNENLQHQGLPDNVRAGLQEVQNKLRLYGDMANALAMRHDPSELPAKMAQFHNVFEGLEASQEKVSKAVHEWHESIRSLFGIVKTMMLWVGTAISVIAVMIALVLQAFVQLVVFRKQNEMEEAMQKIADGDVTTNIPHTDRKDEIGMMARTVQVFKDNALKVQQMAKEREQQEKKSAEEKKRSMQKLADDFEQNVKNVVDMVAAAATEMDATAKNVSGIAEDSKKKLLHLTGEVNQASGNVDTVASATSQLSQSISEITKQVTRATSITTNAVEEAAKADGTVQHLVAAAQKIGEVVDMINSIAEQINLLALNATIEAARAGDAGKGFAVVASEVKTLATETTKATSSISEYISSIQGTTNETVAVIKTISGTIREINEIATAIAAAVEEQGVATQDIAQNVQQAAGSTKEASNEVATVSKSAEQTGEAASQMTAATSELSKQSETLRREVDKFLTGVRTAA